jgi:hypothetical protein
VDELQKIDQQQGQNKQMRLKWLILWHWWWGRISSSPPAAAGIEGSFNLEAWILMLMTDGGRSPRKERIPMLTKLHTLYILHFKQDAENRGRRLWEHKALNLLLALCGCYSLLALLLISFILLPYLWQYNFSRLFTIQQSSCDHTNLYFLVNIFQPSSSRLWM